MNAGGNKGRRSDRQVEMEYSRLQDKCRGALVGGAVGDALGYAVEFDSLEEIIERFGEKGITRYVTDACGMARFSDDTQMSPFTQEGLCNGIIATEFGMIEELMPYIEKSYLDWLTTQRGTQEDLPDSRLSHVDELWVARAPGITCLNALENIRAGINHRNDSKGCGGVMRVAPVGIFCAAHSDLYDYEDTARLAGMAAEITHHHRMSTYASALLATTVRDCIGKSNIRRLEFEWIVEGGLIMLKKYYDDESKIMAEFSAIIHRAMSLAKSDIPERDAIRKLGQGWIAEEALAIAIFSVMRHVGDFEKCVVCAVNHDGDSDSTGAIAGNIIGAILGYSAIPSYFLDNLEILHVLESVADELCDADPI